MNIQYMYMPYTYKVGKYLLVFYVIISIAYFYMAFSKRRNVISQKEKLFDKINSGE